MRLTFGLLQNNNPVSSWMDVFSSVCVCLRGEGQQFSGVLTEYQCFWDPVFVSVENAEDVSNYCLAGNTIHFLIQFSNDIPSW